MHQHLILNCPAQNLRFVSHSAAVCHVRDPLTFFSPILVTYFVNVRWLTASQLHGVKSAVVVSLGQNNRCLVAVRNLVPTHVLPLENVQTLEHCS